MNVANFAFTSVLALAAMLAGILGQRVRAAARDYLRLAACLYGALAIAGLIATALDGATSEIFAASVALVVTALAPAALALAVASAFETPPGTAIAIPALVLAFAAGLTAAMTGEAFVAMAALFASACTMATFAVRGWRYASRAALPAFVASLSLLAGAAAFMTNGREGETTLALFSAASLMGTALACAKASRLAVKQMAAHNDTATAIHLES